MSGFGGARKPRTGTFPTELRKAIEARGLGLARIRDHLAEQGVPVSVSTLSNWQRGVSRPLGGGASRTLSALERLLGVENGELSLFLDPDPAPAGQRHELGPGTPRLRACLDAPASADVTVVSAADEVDVVGATELRAARTRLVLRAERNGVDRHLVSYHTNVGDLPEIKPGAGCRVRRTARDEDTGLMVAELCFAPLVRGETFPIEYGLDGGRHGRYHGRWIHAAGIRFELTVRFAPAAEVRSAHRVWRLDAGSPHKDVHEVRVIGGEVAHLIDADPGPGFHGIRWE